MRLQINRIITTIKDGEQAAPSVAARILRSLGGVEILEPSLVKSSIDARKGQVKFISTVAFSLPDKDAEQLLAKGIEGVSQMKETDPLSLSHGDRPLNGRPVVVGFGPSGMFAALLLAREGYRPIVLERGGPVEERVSAVEGFWNGGALDRENNVQFGEGGAGTFSDGKLTTRINDPLCAEVLKTLVTHGAPQDILFKAKPHVGTDLLRTVVKSIREEILSLGGTIQFHAKVDNFTVKDGAICAISSSGDTLLTDAAVIAVGHSARDTFAALSQSGVTLAPKPFSVGARIEHLQTTIDKALYGEYAGHPNLPSGEYQLSMRQGERAAYTFCMCPGGMVVASASDEEQTVTNGMSYRARELKNANSGLVVSVDSADYGPTWQDAVAFQQRLERAAFVAGGKTGAAPVMTMGKLLGSGKSANPVVPSYPRGVKEADLRPLLPAQITDFLIASLPVFGRKLTGFCNSGAVFTGLETRTSSPVRMPRSEACVAEGVEGLYPCGEGAGYAGGIVSAAVDGLRCASALIARYATTSNGVGI